MSEIMEGSERLDVVRIRQTFGADLLKVRLDRGDTFICVNRERIAEIVQFLRDDPDLAYDYFVECVGVDYSTWPHARDFTERFEVVYNLYSLKNSSRLFIKVAADDGHKIPTCKEVFLGAEYPEREIWDLLGVVFSGNEQTERFLLPEDWIGFPLRKEVGLGGEDVVFHGLTEGPAIEDIAMPHAGESFEGKTGSSELSGR
jgi:NADH-quinone oxidoreductase subunit C